MGVAELHASEGGAVMSRVVVSGVSAIWRQKYVAKTLWDQGKCPLFGV